LPTSAYTPTRKPPIQIPADNGTEMCGKAIMNEVQFLTNGQWHVGQDIRVFAFQEIIIPSCKPGCMYVGCSDLRRPSAVFTKFSLFFSDFRNR
jgi:hypothetical protein